MEHFVKKKRDPVLGRFRFKKKNDDYTEYLKHSTVFDYFSRKVWRLSPFSDNIDIERKGALSICKVVEVLFCL